MAEARASGPVAVRARGRSGRAGGRRRNGIEWPTYALLAGCYALWAISTTWLAAVAPWLAVPVTAVAIAQFSSLQHEALHGHPTRKPWLNEALVFPALTLWVPYRRFRDTHLAHHYDPALTDPYDDPETNFLDPEGWARLAGPVRRVLLWNNTLAGRMALGPAISILRLLRDDWRRARPGAGARATAATAAATAADGAAAGAMDAGAGAGAVRGAWALHGLGLVPVALWLAGPGRMGAGAYLGAAYLGFSLLKIRTYLEHRAHDRPRGRSAIIEDRGPLALLFLNNNLHAVHHQHPQLPWYRLPAAYRARRARYLDRCEHYRFGSYGEVFARYLWRAKDPVPHPLYRRDPPEN